jgi:hypothetical protein
MIAAPVSSVPLSQTQAAGLLRFCNNRSDFAPNPQGRQLGGGHQRRALAGEIVDNSEDAQCGLLVS